MTPCWAAMISFSNPITDDWVGAFLHNSFLSWAARNSTKPGRSTNTENLVIHASAEWTTKHWDRPANEIAEAMLTEFWNVTGLAEKTPTHMAAHRWKYAIPVEQTETGCYFDPSSAIVACGDWANGSRVEGAFLSGMSAAEKILESLSPESGEL